MAFRSWVFGLVLLSVPAAAQSYLTPAQVDLRVLLAPAPVAGSAEDRAELEAVLQAERTRSAERAAQAKADAEESAYAMFTPVLGPAFAQASLPLADVVFTRLGDTEEDIVGVAKDAFARPRPFRASAEVHPVAPMSKSGSYPSGHSTRVTITGLVLAAMVPERREAIFARMTDYAESRVIGGVHYPSDLVAGRVAGTAIVAVLFNDPAFMAAYGPARAEVRRVLGMP